MAEKKGFWASLFGGGGCDCGMSIEEEKQTIRSPQRKKAAAAICRSSKKQMTNPPTIKRAENNCISAERSGLYAIKRESFPH